MVASSLAMGRRDEGRWLRAGGVEAGSFTSSLLRFCNRKPVLRLDGKEGNGLRVFLSCVTIYRYGVIFVWFLSG